MLGGTEAPGRPPHGLCLLLASRRKLGGKRVLPEHRPAQLHSKLRGQRQGQAVAQAVTCSVSLSGGDPPAGTLAPGAAGAELLLQLPLHSHHGRQVLRGAAEQAPGG